MHINPTLQKATSALRRAGVAADLNSSIAAGVALGGVRVYLAGYFQHATHLAETLEDEGCPCRVCTATKTLVLC